MHGPKAGAPGHKPPGTRQSTPWPALAPTRVGFKPSGLLWTSVTLPPTPTATTAAVSGAASPDPGVGLAGTLVVVVLAVLVVRRFA